MSIEIFGMFFVPTLIFGEALYHGVQRLRNKETQFSFQDVGINFATGLIDRFFTGLLWTGVMYAAFYFLYHHLTPLRIDMSQIWAWPLALLLSDFAYYWYHRAGHEVRFFWAIHNVHHSSEHYNFSTSVRLSWLEGLFRWPFWSILPLVGYTPEVTLIAYLAVRLYQVILHSEHIPKLGFLESFLSTPSHHRVHHGRNPQYLDKNYGGVTIIWDKLFGTFTPEQEAVDYGLTTPLASKNLVHINLHEFASLAKDVARAPRWQDRWNYLVKKPGWTP
jgi:sterol desaturase/sphingolipid hydroxylase (fatty acid hydroxylase superfamily)